VFEGGSGDGFLLLQDRQGEEGMMHSGIEEWWEDDGVHQKKWGGGGVQ
jgi:hypothetical protein